MIALTIPCPACDRRLPVAGATPPGAIKCGACFREIPLEWSAAVLADREVDACPVCGGADFYVRKDFDPKTGLAFVVVVAITSAVFYWYGYDVVAYGILAAAVVIDLVVSRMLAEVTVCYRCHAEFRGGYRRTAPAFDLHIADALEPEYERRIGRR